MTDIIKMTGSDQVEKNLPEIHSSKLLNETQNIQSGNALEQTHSSVLATSGSSMLKGFQLVDRDSATSRFQSPQIVAEARCQNGTASYYNPGGTTADGTAYTDDMQGVAVDMNHPVMGVELGQKLVIINNDNGRQTTVRVHDVGNFGDLDGGRRLIDLSVASKNKLGAGDITNVTVCVPER